MPIAYIVIRDGTSGAKNALFTLDGVDGGENGALTLGWRKRINDVHFCEFTIAGDNPDRNYLTDKSIIEVWRYDPDNGIAPYRSFEGILRDVIRRVDDRNRTTIAARAYGYNSLLARRVIAWQSGLNDVTQWASTAAESVMKAIIAYNFDPALATTTNGRDRTPNTLNLTREFDSLRGNIINWSAGNRPNVLTELQKIQRISGGDFNVVNTAGDTVAPAFEFRFYSPILGTDRTISSNKLVFSMDRGNMANPVLAITRSTEKTAAIVGGRGEGAQRRIRTRTSATFSATNDLEMFVDGRNAELDAALDAAGDSALNELKVRAVLEYDVLQTALYIAERDYFLGDFVYAVFDGTTYTQQVSEITFEYDRGREVVSVVNRDR